MALLFLQTGCEVYELTFLGKIDTGYRAFCTFTFASELQVCTCSAIKLFLDLLCGGDFRSLYISKVITDFIHLDRYTYVFQTSTTISVDVGTATYI